MEDVIRAAILALFNRYVYKYGGSRKPCELSREELLYFTAMCVSSCEFVIRDEYELDEYELDE